MTPQPDLITLLADILAGTPKLAGAACTTWPGLHDPAHDGEPASEVAIRHAAARDVCADCSALSACRQWADSEHKQYGVIAGRIPEQPKRGRPPAAEQKAAS